MDESLTESAAEPAQTPAQTPAQAPTQAIDVDERFARAHRQLCTAAVTGTNGKSTTVSMIDAIVAASGEPHARLTTLGAWVAGVRVEASNPTEEFLFTVERAVASGVRTLALEVTSKALANGLAVRWPARVAVFTNLSRDHLDMHESPEAYLAAKAQLFMHLPVGGVAVLNGDDPASDLIREVIPSGVDVRQFSVNENATNRAELVARNIATSAHGTHIELCDSPLAAALGHELHLAITGDVHAQNALAAALATAAMGYSSEAVKHGLKTFAGVPGRFEIAHRQPLVVVDYAHTPDGLRGTLDTARQLIGPGGRLMCVFGCGGNRDRGKRPEMGAVVHQRADVAVLTSDNPRREPPADIAADVMTGVSGPGARWHEELDRRAAIEWAVAEANAADVVVIAGKGHEDYQEIMDQRITMRDVDLVCDAMRSSR